MPCPCSERFGQVAPDELTELPKEYKDLEARVDALKAVHQKMVNATSVFATESYDYPTQVRVALLAAPARQHPQGASS